ARPGARGGARRGASGAPVSAGKAPDTASAPLLAALEGGGHVRFTTRADGNASSVGGVGSEHGTANRERLRRRLGLQAIARGYQVHGARVEVVAAIPPREPAPERLSRADGQATALHEVGVMVL